MVSCKYVPNSHLLEESHGNFYKCSGAVVLYARQSHIQILLTHVSINYFFKLGKQISYIYNYSTAEFSKYKRYLCVSFHVHKLILNLKLSLDNTSHV